MFQHVTLILNFVDYKVQWQKANLQGRINIGLIPSAARRISRAGQVRQTTVAGNDQISVGYLQGRWYTPAIQETLRFGLRCSGCWQTREGKECLQFVHYYKGKILASRSGAYSVFCLLRCNVICTDKQISLYKIDGLESRNISPFSEISHSHNTGTDKLLTL